MKIIICDDESVMALAIQRLCEKWAINSNININISVNCNSMDLLNKLRKNTSDIVLLDIDMPLLSGFDVAKFIADQKLSTLVIFVTNKESLVYESFRYRPFGFVRKSKLENDLCDCLNRANKELMLNDNNFSFKSGANEVNVKISEVIYIESLGNYLNIHTTNEIYVYRYTMKDITQLLCSKGFVRIHKSFLVNMKFINLFSNESVTLTNKDVLPIGRAYSEISRTEIVKYFRKFR